MSELPPEPGTVPDRDHGVPGEAVPLPDGDAEVTEDYVYSDERSPAAPSTGEDPGGRENSSSPLSRGEEEGS